MEMPMLSRFQQFRLRQRYVDLEFQCEDGTSCWAHQVVLAALFPNFDAYVLQQRGAESQTAGCFHMSHSLSETKESDLKLFLDYVYGLLCLNQLSPGAVALVRYFGVSHCRSNCTSKKTRTGELRWERDVSVGRG